MKMYTLGLYEKSMPNTLSIEQKLELAKKANFDYLEICVDASEEKINRINMPQTEQEQIIKQMFKTGIPIDSISVSALTKYALGDLDESISERGVLILKGSITLAKKLGIRIVMIPGYDIYFGESNDETEQKFLKNLKHLTQFAAMHGVVLAFETMENEFMNTVQKAVKYVEIINSPYLQIYPDVGNVTNAVTMYNTSIIDDLKAGAGKIVAMHLKETVPGKFREIPFGTGHVDFETVINTGLKIGVRKFVTELWHVGNDDYFDCIVYANNMMRKIIDKGVSKC